MFRTKRDDTLVGTIEAKYRVMLNARSDMKLGNLLRERGFDSLTHLLDAYYGRLTEPSRIRKLFLSFHAEDLTQVGGFRLMAYNPNLRLDFHDASVRQPIDSEHGGYVRKVIQKKISRCSVVVCLIGNGTAWREWVDWELGTARNLGKGLCGVRLKGSYGRTPLLLRGMPVARWDVGEIISAIESAAARRS